MLIPVLLVLVALFALLFVFRVGAARRRQLFERWPALAFAVAALFAFARGALWPGIALTIFAAGLWLIWPSIRRHPPLREESARSAADPADEAARRVLGVGANADEAEIRRAYRTRMANAHPDRGGSNAEAARLTAARDRLLRRKR